MCLVVFASLSDHRGSQGFVLQNQPSPRGSAGSRSWQGQWPRRSGCGGTPVLWVGYRACDPLRIPKVARKLFSRHQLRTSTCCRSILHVVVEQRLILIHHGGSAGYITEKHLKEAVQAVRFICLSRGFKVDCCGFYPQCQPALNGVDHN